MKETAAEWLFEKLWETPKDKFTWYSILEQAKQMEKEQMEDAWYAGDEDGAIHEFKEYYNETYKSE